MCLLCWSRFLYYFLVHLFFPSLSTEARTLFLLWNNSVWVYIASTKKGSSCILHACSSETILTRIQITNYIYFSPEAESISQLSLYFSSISLCSIWYNQLNEVAGNYRKRYFSDESVTGLTTREINTLPIKEICTREVQRTSCWRYGGWHLPFSIHCWISPRSEPLC